MVKSRLSVDVKIMAIEYYYNNNCSLDTLAQIFKINEKNTINRAKKCIKALSKTKIIHEIKII
tara:strand:+ start:139 stop:327 length:189 start_codon:yes stop_codon:yes gene_type:complete